MKYFGVIVTIILSVTSFSQPMKSVEAIERISFMTGEWILKSKYINQEGQWIDNPNGKAVIRYDFDSLGLYDESIFYFFGRRFGTRSLIGYESQRGVYRFMIMDDLIGYPDVHQGSFEGEDLVLTNVETGTAFIDNGKEIFYKSIYRSEGIDKFSMIIESSSDRVNWNQVQVIDYLRK